MNLCVFSGRMTADPVKTERTWKKSDGTEAKGEVVNFTLACKQGYSKDEAPLYLRVAAWGGLANLVATYGFKGKELTVVGAARIETYVRQNGQPGVAMGLRAETIELHGSAKPDANEPAEFVDAETGEIIHNADVTPF